MKKSLLIFGLFFFAFQLCFSYYDRININPYNDKDFFVVENNNSNNYIFHFDIDENFSNSLRLPDDSKFENYAFNSKKSLIAFIGTYNIYILNYQSMKLEITLPLENNLNYKDTKLAFSKNDSSLICFSKSNLRILRYNTQTWIKSEDYLINANPNFYDDVFINAYGNEYILQKNDSLMFYSLETKKSLRNIGIKSGSTNIKFYQINDYFSYLNNGEVYLSKSTDGIIRTIFNAGLEGSDFFDFQSDFDHLYYFGDSKRSTYIANLITTEIKKYDFNILFSKIENDKMIVSTPLSYYCGRMAEMPVLFETVHLISYPEKGILTAMESGYVHYPSNMVISNDNSLIFVNGLEKFENGIKFNNALVESNSKFLKTIKSNGIGRSFSPENKFLILQDSVSYNFYNISKDIIESKIESKLINFKFSKDKSKIFIFDDNQFKTYEYPSLKEIDDINLQLISQNISAIEVINDIIYFKAGTEFMSLDPVTKNIKKLFDISSLPKNVYFILSPDAKYILLVKAIDNYQLYDYNQNKVIYDYKHKTSIYPSKFGVTFMGNSKLICIFTYDPVTGTDYNTLINLSNGQTSNIFGDNIYLSYDNLHYGYTYCPSRYGFNPLPIIVGIEENLNISTQISPNPTSDYIYVNVGAHCNVLLPEEIEIFNIFGEKNLTPALSEGEGAKIKIDVSNLPAGVYFIKIGEKFEKFIKI